MKTGLLFSDKTLLYCAANGAPFGPAHLGYIKSFGGQRYNMGIFAATHSAGLMGRIINTKISTEPMIEMTSFKPEFKFEDNGIRLKEGTPESEGVSSELLYEFLRDVSLDKSLNMHNIVILRNQKVICRAAFGAQRLDVWKHTFSACKSITSLAIGMLVDDGLLRLEDKVVDLFLGEIGAISKLKLKDMTIEDLLTMRSTVIFGEAESMTTPDWVRGFLNSPTRGEIGEDFRYNSLNTYMLSSIVKRVSGKGLSEFLEERLFSPLGISEYYWEKCPMGIEKGGWGLFIKPEDLGKIGLLVIQNGIWNGKRIISEGYLKTAASKHVEIIKESSSFDYGYQIWVGKNSDTFLFNGMLGQNVIGFRKNGIVIVSNAGNGELFQDSSYFAHLRKYFDRDFKDALEPNKPGLDKLSSFIKSLSLYSDNKGKKRIFFMKKRSVNKALKMPKGSYRFLSGDPNSVGIMPLMLQMVENNYTKGFKGVSFEKRSGVNVLVYEEKNTIYRIPLGFEKPEISVQTFENDKLLVAATAKMRKDEDDRDVLVVRLDFLETPCSRILKFFFEEDEMTIKLSEIPGEKFVSASISDFLAGISEAPLISGFLDKFGDDYINYKVERCLSPVLKIIKY